MELAQLKKVKNTGTTEIGLVLVALFVQYKSEATNFGFSFQANAQDPNMRQVIFRVEDNEYRRTIDIREKYNSISQDIWVDDAGTNILLVLSAVWVENGTNNLPKKFSGSLSLGVYSSTNETPATSIGQGSWKINFNPGSTSPEIAPFTVSRSDLETNRSLYFCQLYLSVPVHPALSNSKCPEDICIWMSDGSELLHYQIKAKDWIADPTEKASKQPSRISARIASQGRTNENNEPKEAVADTLVGIGQTGIVSSNSLPVLGITLKNGYVLINSSPTITNGVLQEANPESYPLVWQPVIESSNTPAGWQLPLKTGAKLFRLKIPDAAP